MAGCTGPAPGSQPRTSAPVALAYEVRIPDPGQPLALVRAQLSNLRGESVTLWLPDRIAFTRLEAPLLEGLRARSPDGSPLAIVPTGPYRWRLVTDGRSGAELEYRVPLTHREDAAVRAANDEYEFPYLAPDHGLLVAGTLFLHPEGVEPGSIRVSFDLPDGWHALAPWPGKGTRDFAPNATPQLVDDVVAIGHWNVQHIRLDRFQATVAFAPGQEELAKHIAPHIEAIVRLELELFGHVPQDRYLFLFGRPGEGHGFGGSPKSASMTLMASDELPLDVLLRGVSHLVAHEFHHTWLRSIAATPDELRFYNEGFTDYFAHVVMGRLGLYTHEEFARHLGRKMTSYQKHAARSATVSLASAGGEGFFANPDDYGIVYDGGLLLAFLLDLRLRRKHPPQDLDRFMRAFNNGLRPEWLPPTDGSSPGPDLEGFLYAVLLALGPAEEARFRRLIQSPIPIDWVGEFRREGLWLERHEKPIEPGARLSGSPDRRPRSRGHGPPGRPEAGGPPGRGAGRASRGAPRNARRLGLGRAGSHPTARRTGGNGARDRHRDPPGDLLRPASRRLPGHPGQPDPGRGKAF